jgi:hypothetical protein
VRWNVTKTRSASETTTLAGHQKKLASKGARLSSLMKAD